MGSTSLSDQPLPDRVDPGDPVSTSVTDTSAIAEALTHARSLHRAGRLRAALDAYESILRLAPGQEDALFGSGLVLSALGAGKASVTQLEKARAAARGRVDIALALAGQLTEVGRLDASEAAYREAVTVSGETRSQFAFALGMRQLGRLEDAEQALRRILERDPGPAPWLALSDVLVDRYRIEEAIAACRNAVDLAPGSSAAHLRLGTRLLEAGQTDAARLAFRDAVRLEPTNTAAHYSLARITRQMEMDDRVDALLRLAARPDLPPRQLADTHFALFKVFDDLGDTDRAFQHLATANGFVRRQFTYSSIADRAYFSRIVAAFDPIVGQNAGSADGPGLDHIFVVGLPRSGTTLVEQILASHPMVHGAGEIQNLRREMLRGLERIGREDAFPDGARHLALDDWRRIGTAYEASLEPSGRPVTVNKTPGNFQMIPAIWAALPRARIVHCRRDPMDTCFSIYRHNFVGWGFLYAYDQSEVAQLYATYRRFMTHWMERRPDGMFELSYERLVADPDATVRALLDYCGLPWNERCLDFAGNLRLVRTASLEQVREPIHDRSVGAWRRYADQLGEMRVRLNEEGIAVAPPSFRPSR